jgi:anti-sigma28 factor (negative regulator of flagellin synthesis)
MPPQKRPAKNQAGFAGFRYTTLRTSQNVPKGLPDQLTGSSMDDFNNSRNFSKSLQAAATATARSSDSDIPAIDATSNERIKRIAQLKQQLLDGTYDIDARKLSKRLIDKHLL